MSRTLVLGAGFAGLAAATRLRARGLDVHVLEARDRVGGRARTSAAGAGVQIDLGGQWFGPTQTRMYALAAEHGVELFPSVAEGAAFSRIGGVDRTEPYAAADTLLEEVDRLAATVDLDDPAATPDAVALDTQTLRTWLAARADDATAAYVGRVLAGGLLAKSAGEVSVLQVLSYVRSGSGVDSLLGMAGGAQQDRLVGGPEELARRMADALGADTFTHGFVVDALALRDGAWTVTARDGRTAQAERVVSALPAPLLTGIAIEPALPAYQRRALASLTTGNALKLHAVYDAPLWRERGLSGVFNSGDGWITEAVDNSVPGHPQAVLTCFAYGDEADGLSRLAPEERRRVVLAELAERLGEPRLVDPVDFVDFSWSDEPFTRGCFSSTFAVGALHRSARDLRTPWQGLHLAGTETATVWNGYFEGAVRSGEREADLVADALVGGAPR